MNTETEMTTAADAPDAPAMTDAPEQGTDLTEKYPLDQPITRLDAKDLRSMFQAAHDWLAHNYEYVNKLNVFPVPDGDTGTNMLLTIKSAWHSILHRLRILTHHTLSLIHI